MFPTADGPIGLQPPGSQPVRATVQGDNAAVGDLYCFDLSLSDSSVTDLSPGSTTSGWSNVVAPTAGYIDGGEMTVFAVCVEAANDGLIGRFVVGGYVDAFVIAAAGSVAIGSDLVPTTAKNLDLVLAVLEIHAAKGNEVVTTPTTRTLGNVFLYGWAGMIARGV